MFGFAYVYQGVRAVTQNSNIISMKNISRPAVGARGFQNDRFRVALNLCDKYKTQPLLLNVRSFHTLKAML